MNSKHVELNQSCILYIFIKMLIEYLDLVTVYIVLYGFKIWRLNRLPCLLICLHIYGIAAYSFLFMLIAYIMGLPRELYKLC